jgi:2-octaprenylphenol hydroxylase
MNRSASGGREFSVLIVGGGVIGLTMASLAVARKLAAPGRVAVIADRPASPPSSLTLDSDWDLRVYALSRASQRLLTICGVWQGLPPTKRGAYERMCVWETRGAGTLTFDCAELGEANLGFIVEGRALQSECRRAAQAAGVVFIESAVQRVCGGDSDVVVGLHDGRELRGQLLIGADGTASTVRGLLKIDTAGHVYHQDALVAHVRTAQPHRKTAWQRFLPTGPLAFLPLPDGRSSIVWSATRAAATRLRALDAAAFGAALTAASEGILGTCELTTPLAAFPLKLQYALDYVRPRAVLLGDAAHVVHPLAGQGLNLGLLDCASLADVLGASGNGGDCGEPRELRRYERWRRSENLLAAAAMDGLERVFSSSGTVLSRLRGMGLEAVDRSSFVKRALARYAMGASGDVPRFLRDAPGPGEEVGRT